MTQQTDKEIYEETLHRIVGYIDKGGTDVDKVMSYAIDALYESRK